MSANMIYTPPGAGAVALACNHGVRYPDVCGLCLAIGKPRPVMTIVEEAFVDSVAGVRFPKEEDDL